MAAMRVNDLQNRAREKPTRRRHNAHWGIAVTAAPRTPPPSGCTDWVALFFEEISLRSVWKSAGREISK